MLAVHKYLLAGLRIFCCRMREAYETLGPGRQQLKLRKVAIEDRQVRNFFLIEYGGDVGPIRLQQRRFRCNFNSLSGGWLQRGVNTSREIRGYLDIFNLLHTKIGGLDLDGINVRNQMLYGIVAITIGCRSSCRGSLLNIGCCNLCSWYDGTRAVRDGADNIAIDRLTKTCCGHC